jgi:hypothetical protein
MGTSFYLVGVLTEFAQGDPQHVRDCRPGVPRPNGVLVGRLAVVRRDRHFRPALILGNPARRHLEAREDPACWVALPVILVVSVMPRRSTLLLLNSDCAYTIALMLTFTLHEFGHALPALALGFTPTVRLASVEYGTAPPDMEVIIALAGPFVSLITGVLFLIVSRATMDRGFWRMVVLWLGALGVQEFSGYLMTGPFVPFGDIGEALQLLAAPGWVYALTFAVGIGATALLGAIVTRRLVELTDPDGVALAGQLRSLGLFAWLIGSAVVIGVGGFDNIFSAVGFFELLGTVTIGIFLLWVRFFMDRLKVVPRGARVGWPVVGIVLVIIVAVARHFILGPGVTL